jgi:hypothetical protein|tara:strand:- start:9012 stop:9422 length:411 start_codon:yes stop_codon:yes gene_type:complete
MGFKLSLVLGGLLLVSWAGSAWYIDRLQDEVSTLKGNQIVLEGEIQKQNDSIKNFLEQQKQSAEQLNSMALKNQEAQREVNKLRNTFAKHDMDDLALNKPGLLEKMVNRGTKRVKEELIAITDPNQFEPDETDNTN